MAIEPVQVRNVVFGQGRPKLIVPIVGITQAEVLAAAHALESQPHDVVEWRLDFMDGAMDQTVMLPCLARLRDILGDTPLLATFRTAGEGGAKPITRKAYAMLVRQLAQSGLADLIDVEIFSGGSLARGLIRDIHAAGAKVVASNHDFVSTPPRAELLRRLRLAQDMGGDILEIAVMPTCSADVLELLSATEEMARNYAERPLICMSMGEMGVLTRIGAESIGACASFGCVGKESAPGQLQAEELSHILNALHANARESGEKLA